MQTINLKLNVSCKNCYHKKLARKASASKPLAWNGPSFNLPASLAANLKVEVIFGSIEMGKKELLREVKDWNPWTRRDLSLIRRLQHRTRQVVVVENRNLNWSPPSEGCSRASALASSWCSSRPRPSHSDHLVDLEARFYSDSLCRMPKRSCQALKCRILRILT